LERKPGNETPIIPRFPIEQIDLDRVRRITAGRTSTNPLPLTPKEEEIERILKQDSPGKSLLFADSPVQVYSVHIPTPPSISNPVRPPTPFPHPAMPNAACEHYSNGTQGLRDDRRDGEKPYENDEPPRYDNNARIPLVVIDGKPSADGKSDTITVEINAMNRMAQD
jgi:hypothetical protein